MVTVLSSAVGRALVVTAFAGAWLSAAPVNAEVVVDQDALVAPTAETPTPVVSRIGDAAPGRPAANIYYAQRITAGRSGILSHIDFQIAQFGGAAPGAFFGAQLIDGDYETGARDEVTFAGLPSVFLPTLTQSLAGTGLFRFNVGDYRVRTGQVYSVVFAAFPFEPNGAVGGIVGTGSPFVPPVPGSPPPPPPTFAYNVPAGARLTGYVNGSQTASFVSNGNFGFRTFVETAGVPEPTTWAMMIIGFGLIGGAMRQRRPTLAAAA
jgi:PEP-CTERM motif